MLPHWGYKARHDKVLERMVDGRLSLHKFSSVANGLLPVVDPNFYRHNAAVRKAKQTTIYPVPSQLQKRGAESRAFVARTLSMFTPSLPSSRVTKCPEGLGSTAFRAQTGV